MNPNTQATSDYRGSQNNASTVSINRPDVSTTGGNNSQPSYSNAIKSTPKINFPQKEQAIVLNAIEGLKLADYIHSLAALIGPKNIIFASRIANNRICIYLSSKQLVDQLLESRSSIQVGEAEVGMRRLITPAKRLLLSNVCPTIPHEIIENCLKNAGFKLVSPITFLRAGLAGEEFAHILSFRRQVYVTPDSEDLLQTQTSLVLPFDDTQYRIFLSSDEMTCFLCKQKGHIANNCVNIPVGPQTNQTDRTNTSTENQEEIPQQTAKRPLQSSASSETPKHDVTELPDTKDDDSLPNKLAQKTLKAHTSRKDSLPKSKRPRNSSSSPTPFSDTSLQSIKALYDDSLMPLPFSQFISFLENSFGTHDPVTEARRFTTDIALILETMHKVYPHIQERSLKARFTRLSNKLKNQLQSEGINTENMVSISPHHSLLSNCSQEEMDTLLLDLSTHN